MYQIAVSFDIPAEHREEFIAAALEDSRNSLRDEPGTLRFELVADADNPNRFHLSEAYTDEDAFNAHGEGEHYAKFIHTVRLFADAPTWHFKGTRITDTP